MVREDVGEIAFDYGKPGTPEKQYRNGFGFSHIVARRDFQGGEGERFAREVIPEVLARGQLRRICGPPNGRRAEIVHRGDMAVLSLYRHENRETWVLSGYELSRGGSPDGSAGGNPDSDLRTPPPRFSDGVGAGPEGNVEPDLPSVNAGRRRSWPRSAW